MERKLSKAEKSLQERLQQRNTPISGIEALFGSRENNTEETQAEAQEKEPTQFPEDLVEMAQARTAKSHGVGRPKKREEDKSLNKTNSERFTTILTHTTADKIRTISFETSTQVKDIVETFLLRGIESYEKENGKVKIRKKGFRL